MLTRSKHSIPESRVRAPQMRRLIRSRVYLRSVLNIRKSGKLDLRVAACGRSVLRVWGA